MFIWRIFGSGLNDIYVLASSYDEALAAARIINKNYNGGQVSEVIKEKIYE